MNAYPAPVQKHIESRQPIESRPDVVENLAKGGLKPEDVDYIILSHVRSKLDFSDTARLKYWILRE